jgi:hypothetical protein
MQNGWNGTRLRVCENVGKTRLAAAIIAVETQCPAFVILHHRAGTQEPLWVASEDPAGSGLRVAWIEEVSPDRARGLLKVARSEDALEVARRALP